MTARSTRSLLLLPLLAGVAFAGDPPVVPNASSEARSLLAYFQDVYGTKIISGQQQGWLGTNALGFELTHIQGLTGKLPALRAFDLAGYTRVVAATNPPPRNGVVERAANWYTQSNGIVSLCWHWVAPIGERVFYTKETTFDPARSVATGTPEYEAALRDMDDIAAELKRLRDAGVPVLWRPLHEANGRWFWWGAGGPEPFKKLWHLMFERFTMHHQLTNLLWVYSPGAAIDLADWFPGDAYVDIIAPDHYPMDGNHEPAREIFDEMVALASGQKLVAFGENGPIPDPVRLASSNAGWLFFIAWSGRVLTQNNSDELVKAVYSNPYVVTLADLPSLKRYAFVPADRPSKLVFLRAPRDLAVGNPGRLPVLVALQDATGRTVREQQLNITLSLAESPFGGTLAGTFNARTVNGIATFADLAVSKAGRGYALRASADGFRDVASPGFQVGPGSGVVREWWTNTQSLRLEDLAGLDRPPHGRDVLGRAFEAPVWMQTNYAARFRGELIPPLSGSYTFWIANDGLSEFWLSTDDTPANKVKIAEITGRTPYVKWPHTHEAVSAEVRLEAGRRYFAEVLQKLHAGSAHLSVRWRLPDGAEERPIPAARFTAPPVPGFNPVSTNTAAKPP